MRQRRRQERVLQPHGAADQAVGWACRCRPSRKRGGPRRLQQKHALRTHSVCRGRPLRVPLLLLVPLGLLPPLQLLLWKQRRLRWLTAGAATPAAGAGIWRVTAIVQERQAQREAHVAGLHEARPALRWGKGEQCKAAMRSIGAPRAWLGKLS